MPHRFKVTDGQHPYFVTCVVTHWIPVFCREEHFRVLADSLSYCCMNKGLLVHGYVIMPDHWHAIVSQAGGMVVDVMRDMKGYMAREIKPLLMAEGRTSWVRAMENAGKTRSGFAMWQEGHHPEQVYSQAFLNQKLEYMHNNPVRAGYVDEAWKWRYSSAGFYLRDEPSPVAVTPVEF